ncbi:MAG TPA: hypothetical protein VMF30_10915 [Pirellulales bacterium]|nr:hypothetical protein [Pirellulales bacterium]
MKRLILGAWLLAIAASTAVADPPTNELPPPQTNPPANPPARAAMPPRHQQRWRYSSYGVWVRTNGPGYPAYRYTWRGQKDNFPMPAIFHSGSEHTNYTWGSGLE